MKEKILLVKICREKYNYFVFVDCSLKKTFR